MSIAPATRRTRVQARVQGTVQGVGFRPYVYRLARELGLGGFVLNDSYGVLVEVEGANSAVEEFLARLEPEAPPLAIVEGVTHTVCEPAGLTEFAIRASPRGGTPDASVTPDTATCADCLRELFDAADRRYRYPFINCTNCGPRFTIVRGIPYDRPFTTMAGFTMCERCRAEYDDPGDRRFHAQPNACADCGPRVTLLQPAGSAVRAGAVRDPLGEAAAALREGQILAVKGIGGFHLACIATDERAVARLRARKHREDKPFALMVADLAAAAKLITLTDPEGRLLEAPQRPIVLASRREDSGIAPSVAPGAPELGVMLAYSPLHHLLLCDVDEPLVMTSGNVSDEPIAYEDDDALARLASIADAFLVHDRPIETRTDDSVVRVIASSSSGRRTAFIRRSRGYVPASITLPEGTPVPLLACGAELKSTFCVARDDRAWVSHHIGDLKNYETLLSFTDGIAHFERLFSVDPQVVAHDLHPDYLSTRYALERDGVETIAVQHHHAHLAACLAEHGEAGPAVGAIFDGAGHGPDGTVWGGELLLGDLAGFERVGHLLPSRLPGGDRAVREPWRMACAWLAATWPDQSLDLPAALAGRVDQRSWERVGEMVKRGLASPETTSMGRLFDAVSSLCGIRAVVNYEGQAAIELEAGGDPGEHDRYPIAVTGGAGGSPLVIDPRETIEAILEDLRASTPAGIISSRFHAAVSTATIDACSSAASAHGTDVVVLSGGVFLNRRLLKAVSAGLQHLGLRVLIPELLPAGDGGIAFGQAAVAAALSRAGA